MSEGEEFREEALRLAAERINAQLAASEARTDAKFEKLLGKLDIRLANLNFTIGESKDSLAPLKGLKTTMVLIATTTVIVITALMLALLYYGNDRFGAGMDASAIANEAAKRAVEQALPRQSLGIINSQPVAQTAAEARATAQPP
jgi:hypothetical protein